MDPSSITGQCTSCGADIYGTRFCESCGTRVAEAAHAPASAPVAAAAPAEAVPDADAATERIGPPALPRAMRLPVIIGVVAAAAAVVTAIAVVIGTNSGAVMVEPEADVAPSAEPITAESAAPALTEAPSDPPAAPALAPLPERCEGLFSPAMSGLLESYGVALNPPWTETEERDTTPFLDAELNRIVESTPFLRCMWVNPLGGSGFGIETRIVAVDAALGGSIEQRLQALGYTANQELGGVRYVTGSSANEGEGIASGESHIVVGGYWFATSWVELGVSGYTADMVTNLLGRAVERASS